MRRPLFFRRALRDQVLTAPRSLLFLPPPNPTRLHIHHPLAHLSLIVTHDIAIYRHCRLTSRRRHSDPPFSPPHPLSRHQRVSRMSMVASTGSLHRGRMPLLQKSGKSQSTWPLVVVTTVSPRSDADPGPLLPLAASTRASSSRPTLASGRSAARWRRVSCRSMETPMRLPSSRRRRRRLRAEQVSVRGTDLSCAFTLSPFAPCGLEAHAQPGRRNRRLRLRL